MGLEHSAQKQLQLATQPVASSVHQAGMEIFK